MRVDRILCQKCGEELQEEESCPKCGTDTKKHEISGDIVIKIGIGMRVTQFNKKGDIEKIEEQSNGRIKRYDAKFCDGEIYQEIEEERKTVK